MKNDSVLAQIEATFQRGNRLAATVGVLLGGFVPISIFILVHYDINAEIALYKQVATYLITGGLFFSAKTVYQWTSVAYRCRLKALGYVILAEGIMTFTHVFWLACIALGFLVTINGVATACNLILDWKAGVAKAKAETPVKQQIKRPVNLPKKSVAKAA